MRRCAHTNSLDALDFQHETSPRRGVWVFQGAKRASRPGACDGRDRRTPTRSRPGIKAAMPCRVRPSRSRIELLSGPGLFVFREETPMRMFALVSILCLVAGSAHAQTQSCTVLATNKKLHGAALTSFMKKCES